MFLPISPFARQRRRMRGAVAVGFALVAPILFLLLFGIIDLALMFWVDLTMQYAVREGARYSVTGQSDLDPAASAQQRYLAVIEKIRRSSMGMYDQLNPQITVTNYGNDGSNARTVNYDPAAPSPAIFGGPGDIVVLQLNNCAWTRLTVLAPLFKDGKYTFNVAATMRNEAFP
ncbi:pilus assembly protein [Massilia sp. R2A-15]|uniref:TadE/TadG family type IV pilus assembly protein n=1 Tax=Massilia sp. R2A-15 TaxID=3064278 RepID=UPI002732FB47|nr:TadE family protein [Massilia sp. R2A-15]WLI87755.1 pilus assembly protein [Massilia sp. R2A-15]